jgi:hypothetical protein
VLSRSLSDNLSSLNAPSSGPDDGTRRERQRQGAGHQHKGEDAGKRPIIIARKFPIQQRRRHLKAWAAEKKWRGEGVHAEDEAQDRRNQHSRHGERQHHALKRACRRGAHARGRFFETRVDPLEHRL